MTGLLNGTGDSTYCWIFIMSTLCFSGKEQIKDVLKAKELVENLR